MDTQSVITTKTGIQKIGKNVTSELPMVKDANVNSRDRLNDFLQTYKNYLVSYQVAINEIVNDDLRKLLIENRNSIQNLHTRIFDELFNMGEYQIDMATGQQIMDSVEVFQGYRAQLPNI